jgi:hypothetical protein
MSSCEHPSAGAAGLVASVITETPVMQGFLGFVIYKLVLTIDYTM